MSFNPNRRDIAEMARHLRERERELEAREKRLRLGERLIPMMTVKADGRGRLTKAKRAAPTDEDWWSSLLRDA